MRLFAKIGLSLALLHGLLTPGRAQDPTGRRTDQCGRVTAPSRLEPVILGEPEPIVFGLPEPIIPPIEVRVAPALPFQATDRNVVAAGNVMAAPSSIRSEPQQEQTPAIFPFAAEMGWRQQQGIVIRCQAPEPPPPSPFGAPPSLPSGPGPAPVFGPQQNPLDCGIPSDKSGNFWERFQERMKNCGKDVFGSLGTMFQPNPEHKMFQSDHAFDMFSSPVTNPFFFMDPRSLTEVRPIFIYQQTRNSNPIFAGGSNYFVGLQGSVALTDWISIKISEFGVSFMEPNNPGNNPGFGPNVGISELHVGPQITFIRNKETKTIVAGGLTFEIPWGSNKVFQHTGTLGVVPYISFGQNFLSNEKYGSFNFLNTTGWAGGAQRLDFFFSSFHLDYNIKNLDRFFPMIELNWAHYTNSGNQNPIGFEGFDLYNFGSNGVAGTDEVTLNFGGRVRINNFWQVGAAAGFSVLGGGSHLDGFRLTVDMIFRY